MGENEGCAWKFDLLLRLLGLLRVLVGVDPPGLAPVDEVGGVGLVGRLSRYRVNDRRRHPSARPTFFFRVSLSGRAATYKKDQEIHHYLI